MKHSLLLVAHGSRLAKANMEFHSLCISLQQHLKISKDSAIVACFLELAKPSLQSSIEKALQSKSSIITIVPYFLHNGSHIHKDIPLIVHAFAQENIHCQFKIVDYLGKNSQILKLLLQVVKQHL